MCNLTFCIIWHFVSLNTLCHLTQSVICHFVSFDILYQYTFRVIWNFVSFDTLWQTNMLTSQLTSHISSAKWTVSKCQPRDSWTPETIPHWMHCTNLWNPTSQDRSLSPTSQPSAWLPPITSSCARMSPPSWSRLFFSHPLWPRGHQLLNIDSSSTLMYFLPSGTNNLSWASATSCLNPLSGCPLFMANLFVFINKHEFSLKSIDVSLSAWKRISTQDLQVVVLFQ